MKKLSKIVALTLLASLSANAVGLVNPASSNVSYAAQELDFGINTDKFKSQSLTLNLKQDEASRKASIAARNKIRSDMWDKNVPYTLNGKSNDKNTKLRDCLRELGINSKEEYLNQTKWSTGLEKIAIQRTYELYISGLSHTRPDGSDCMDAVLPDGTESFGEIIAYETTPYTPYRAFEQWTYTPYDGKSEYDQLIASNGVFNADNGHLHLILNPELEYMGHCVINNNNGKNYTTAIFGYGDSTGNKSVGLVGTYTMYFGKDKAKIKENESKKTENQTKDKNKGAEISEQTRQELEKAIYESKIQIDAVNFLLEHSADKIKHVRDKVEKLLKESEELIKEAEKILGIA
ncbi:CAP domain-containing protein [uncultured Anaerococcus sp.]|uniref:CAP domain-containing protein n=1 Tax=uncultured Anaerococcus sp. TaxID=293428 RepID=UPI00288BD9C5|nr:CAP domain-containing protein [uncultured Anaerococcus sp.]